MQDQILFLKPFRGKQYNGRGAYQLKYNTEYGQQKMG